MMTKVDQYYGILDLKPGDSIEQVKQAHRDLAFVWHPDRYTHSPRLLEKAQEKLKIINEAHEQLLMYQVSLMHEPRIPSYPAHTYPAHAKSGLNIELL